MGKTYLRLPRIAPSAAGLDSNAVMDFLDAARSAGVELHSLMIAIDGKVAAEGWWEPYAPGIRHGGYSATKTFTAAAIGFAEAEGRLKLEDKLEQFFPEEVKPGRDENLHLLTIHDLLCLACGQDAEVDIADSADAVETFMDAKFPYKPGAVFQYNSIASHMLAEIIFRLTGQTLPEYLKPRLFDPLGITDVRWDRTPQGIPMGGWGIHIRTEDYLKMGMLFLQHGKWNGKQIFPEGWAERAMSCQIDNGAGREPGTEWSSGYGYQMWLNVTPDSTRMDGAYGQLTFIYMRRNAVISLTSAAKDIGKEMEIVRTVLLPGITGKKLSQPYADSRLLERLSQLSLNETGRVCRSGLEARFTGNEIVFDGNSCSLIPESQRDMAFLHENGVRRMALRFYSDACLLSWSEGTADYTAKIGLNGCYSASELSLPCALNPLVSVGYWDGSTFCFILRTIEDPHSLQVRLTVDEDSSVQLAYFDPILPANGKGTKCSGRFRAVK